MTTDTQNLYRLLRTKDIISILNGDTSFGEYEFKNKQKINIGLPRLSGPKLCEICTLFGYPITYHYGSTGTNLTRREYLNVLLEHCIQHKKCSELLVYLFDKKQFTDLLKGNACDEIELAHKTIINEVIQQINGLLLFGGNQLIFLGNQFKIIPKNTEIITVTPTIKSIDRPYIKSISERSMQDIEQKNFDSAITKSRTLLEETFCYVIEKKNITPTTSGDIKSLYKQVKDLYKMHYDTDTDKRIKMLLSGLEKILSSISEMRNKDSDAHGVGLKRININTHHARLFVNTAISMSEFILDVAMNQTKS